MSHRTYQTEGIVLSSANVGEANRSLTLFTRDFGLVRALARSVREERSKLRYSLEPFSVVALSLVRGRDFWRVTGAIASVNLAFRLARRRAALASAAHLASLLIRLLQGEEAQRRLYDVVARSFAFLGGEELSKDELFAFECLTVLRMLALLGYLAPDRVLAPFTEKNGVSRELLAELFPHRSDAIRSVNAALHESQL